MKLEALRVYWHQAIDARLAKHVVDSNAALYSYILKNGTEAPQLPDLLSLVREPVPEVFVAPFIREEFCKLLLDAVLGEDFVVNSEEDSLRQIPEYVFDNRDPATGRALWNMVDAALNPVFLALWGRVVKESHIQVAKYNPADKKKGAWHHDLDSDITVVVPLNTGEYQGGGTEFYRRGTVPPQPTGSAVIFPGSTHLHRGLEVLDGDRYLLVFWLRFGELK